VQGSHKQERERIYKTDTMRNTIRNLAVAVITASVCYSSLHSGSFVASAFSTSRPSLSQHHHHQTQFISRDVSSFHVLHQQQENHARTVTSLRSTKLKEEQIQSSKEKDEDNGALLMDPLSSISTTATTEGTAAVSAMEEGGWANSLLWRGVVVILCALWASNFAAAKVIMAEPGVDSALYALTRFSVAALALLPGSINAVRRGAIDKETAWGAAKCGSWVAFGYLGQTLGLLSTTASKSCVICSMHCVFVAIVAEYMRNQKALDAGVVDTSFDTKRLLPAAVAVAGVAIIELQGAAGAPTVGDALSFAQPIGFGLGYLLLEDLMRQRPQAALPVSAIKLCVVATASFLFFELSPFILHGESVFPPRIPDFAPILNSPSALGGVLYTGLITTALALWVESIAFKRVPATDASIILTTEPLFAAAAGAVTLGETFVTSDYVGASLIIGACILAVLIEDEASDESCDPYDDSGCVPPRTWPEGFE